jgi:hypothetical protein
MLSWAGNTWIEFGKLKKGTDGTVPIQRDVSQRLRSNTYIYMLAETAFAEQLGNLLLIFGQLAEHGHLNFHGGLQSLRDRGHGHGG